MLHGVTSGAVNVSLSLSESLKYQKAIAVFVTQGRRTGKLVQAVTLLKMSV
jgi:hypothetical protein